jgi:hypothetical protein
MVIVGTFRLWRRHAHKLHHTQVPVASANEKDRYGTFQAKKSNISFPMTIFLLTALENHFSSRSLTKIGI